jgi:hypothetical protein
MVPGIVLVIHGWAQNFTIQRTVAVEFLKKSRITKRGFASLDLLKIVK